MTGKHLLLALLATAAFAQDPVSITPYQLLDARSGQAVACSGCSIYTYAAGTNTPLATYTSSTLATPNTNPVLTNSAGYAVNGATITGIWVGSSCYKFVAKDATAVTLFTQDNICDRGAVLKALLAASGGAALIGFQPTGGTVPLTVAGALNSGFLYSSGYTTLALGCAAANANSRTLAIVATIANSPTQSLNCNIWFPSGVGAMIQPASGAMLTLTGAVTADAVKIFDYSAGGTVNLASAKVAAHLPEWYGITLDSGSDSVTAINRAATAAGVGKTIYLTGGSDCYYVSTSILPLSYQSFVGVGSSYSTSTAGACVKPFGGMTGDLFAPNGIGGVQVRDIKFDGNGTARDCVHLTGVSGNNTHSIIGPLIAQNCTRSQLHVAGSYGIDIKRVLATATGVFAPTYGILIDGVFNNTITIDGGEQNFSAEAAVYIANTGGGSDTITIRNVIQQANGKHGVWVASQTAGLVIDNNHFEQNGGSANGYDIYIPFVGGYDTPSRNISITNNDFNDNSATAFHNQAMFISSTAGLFIHGNKPGSSVSTDGTAIRAAVYLGQGVSGIDPWPIGDNGGMSLFNQAGNVLNPWVTAPFSEQLFKYTSELDNAVWSSVLTQSGVLAPDNSEAWLLGSLSTTSSSPSQFSQAYTATVAGHQFGTCSLLKAVGGGTPFAIVWASIAGTENYTGSSTNQPSRVYLGSDWQWICGTMTYPLSDALGFVVMGFKAWAPTGSTATGIEIAPKMHSWMDSLAEPLFVATRNNTVRRGFPGFLGETVFSQLFAAANGTQLVCADCTIASPTAGGGAGALAVRIGGIWAGK